jgi:hypothetical protein
MSNGRVITRPGQLDELRHGHRTALRSSADDSPGDARLDPAARTVQLGGLGAGVAEAPADGLDGHP